MKEYTYPYTAYLGQYSVSIPEDTVLGNKYERLRNLWAETLKRLLLSKSDEEFDSIVEEYKVKANELGIEKVYIEATKQMKNSKIRMGIEGSDQ